MKQSTDSLAHDQQAQDFVALGVAVLVVSDTRTLETDTSGHLLQEALRQAGHRCTERVIVPDEIPAIQNQVGTWCELDAVQVIVITGGTGVTKRDITPEALDPLYDKRIPGFGELFRWLSYQDIGTSTIQSRAEAGTIAGKLVFALPGSRGACRLAIEEIILPQLDARTKPCSFTGLMDRF